MIKHILVDMDGVMSNFFESAMNIWEDKMPKKFPSGEWDFPEVLGVSNNQFWQRIDDTQNFWENLEPYPWLHELLDYLNSLKLPWTVATSPNKDPGCPTGKIKWLRKHISPNFKSYMIGSQKELMANPNTILLDDTPKKIKAFSTAGGCGVLWPAPWNRLSHIKNPIPYIKSVVRMCIDDNSTSSS